ncbi:MAG TPA: cellulase family glycosylhydrolase, partial [Marinagarivorans sp.]
MSSSSAPTNSDAVNILGSNGTFDEGPGLFGGSVTAPVDASFTWNGEVDVQVNETSEETWHVQLTHGLSVEEGQQYTICFSAKAGASRTISVNIDQDGTPGVGQPDDAGYQSVMSTGGEQPVLLTNYSDYQYTFTSTVEDTSARLTMNFGVLWDEVSIQPLSDASVQVDNIGVYEGTECGDPSAIPAPPTGSGGKHIADYIAQNNAVPPITTEGNKVLFDGKPGSIAGVSLFWSNTGEGEKFYTADVVAQLKTNWNAPLIRAAMAVEDNFNTQGYEGNPTYNVQRVTRVVDAAKANNMYAIIDWHSHHAEAPQSRVEASKTFFNEMAMLYGNDDNVIFEIYNE